MAKHNYVTELPADAVQLMYSGVELFVTPRGDVFKKTKTNKLLKLAWAHKGKYGHAQINIKTKQTTASVYRLVALAFIPNPNNLPLVCHKSEVLDANGFLDNSVGNLFWGSHQDNVSDKNKKGRQAKGSDYNRSKLNDSDIPTIRHLYATGKSIASIAKMYNITWNAIHDIIIYRCWKHV